MMTTTKQKVLAIAAACAVTVGAGAIPAMSYETTTIESAAVLANTATAVPSICNISLNGVPHTMAAYNIGGNNYFKLRDLAELLYGTYKRFEVQWSGAKKAITIITKTNYGSVGMPSEPVGSFPAEATLSTAKIYKDDTEINCVGYNIHGYTYYKLRDIADSLGIGVEWDGAKRQINLTVEQEAVPDGTKEVLGNPGYSYKTGYVDVDWLKNVLSKDDVTDEMLRNWELAMVDLVNEERAKIGMPALKIDDNVMGYAQWWAKRMVTDVGFEHSTVDERREYAAKINIDKEVLDGGENINWSEILYPYTESPVTRAINSFMNSKGHRYTMLEDTDLTRVGIGFAVATDGSVYCCQKFGL